MSGGGVGYADCGCACHRKCHLDVKSKCTQAVAQGSAALAAPVSTATDTGAAAADGGASAATALVARTHRFEVVAVGTPTFCAHCGLMLPIGKKKTHKCKGPIHTHVRGPPDAVPILTLFRRRRRRCEAQTAGPRAILGASRSCRTDAPPRRSAETASAARRP